jgi:hypothetical protein
MPVPTDDTHIEPKAAACWIGSDAVAPDGSVRF